MLNLWQNIGCFGGLWIEVIKCFLSTKFYFFQALSIDYIHLQTALDTRQNATNTIKNVKKNHWYYQLISNWNYLTKKKKLIITQLFQKFEATNINYNHGDKDFVI